MLNIKNNNSSKNLSSAKYRHSLPQLANEMFLTDSGLETTLVFHEGLDLPEFAAFPLMEDENNLKIMQDYYRRHASLACELGLGFVLESVTWRANSDWGAKIGYEEQALDDANRKAIDFLCDIRDEFKAEKSKMVISGCIGPRGDGYAPKNLMTAEETEKYHSAQIKTLSETPADMVSAITINYVEEAIGITRAAASFNIPVVISFTVETDGKLPSGQTLRHAIETVDMATLDYPAYYMINCAHPTHFDGVLEADESWVTRIGGIRANASAKSHAELDESPELDAGSPKEFGEQYRQLLEKLTAVRVIGGCCGTDLRHINEIAKACFESPAQEKIKTDLAA